MVRMRTQASTAGMRDTRRLRRAPWWALAVGAVLVWVPVHVVAQPAPIQDIDEWIEEVQPDWEIPGLAVAVVSHGETVWAQGFGVRNIDTGEPVDEHTIFAIGSSSKAFTSAALGMLVQEGKIEWSDPLRKHLPWFELTNEYIAHHVTLRDALSHRSGYNGSGTLWYGTDLSRREVLEAMRYEPQANPFRTTFVYNNNMYMAAGEVIPTITGMTWDEFVTQRIFEPLGMNRTVTSTVPLAEMPNVAEPHLGTGEELRVVPYRRIDNIGPAGSINSSVADMARWVELHLGRGMVNGQRLLDEDIVEEMHTPQMAIPLEGRWADMMQPSNLLSYGLGWFLHDYEGRKVVQHGGNIDGMHAMVGMMPDENLGVVVLTNRNPNSLSDAIMFRIFDAYIGLPETDWSERYGGGTAGDGGGPQGGNNEPTRVEGTSPSLSLDRYVGTYRHEAFGDFVVTRESGGLVLRYSRDRIGDLTHWHFDTFRIDWRYPTANDSFVTFELDAQARVKEADLQGYGELTRVRD